MFKHILNDEEGSRVNVAFSLNICVVYFSVRDILPTFHEKKEGWEVKLFCWFSQLYRDLKSENWYVRWGKCWDSSEMHVLDTYQHQRQPSIEYGRRAKRGGGEGGIFRIFLSLTLNSLQPPQAWSPLGFIQNWEFQNTAGVIAGLRIPICASISRTCWIQSVWIS